MIRTPGLTLLAPADRRRSARPRRRPSRSGLHGIALALLLPATLLAASGCTLLRDQRQVYHLNHPYPVTDPAFARSLETLGTALTEGNRIEVLNNGDEIFPAMLQAIRDAKASIDLESYIFKDDATGQTFGEALMDAARRGVEVRLLVDGYGGLHGPYLQRLRQAGVDARIYNPIRPWTLRKLGHRTHRKILVVDGAICFTGGAGIADEWRGNARNPKEWREVQVRAAGPVAAQMQAVFSEDWTYTSGEVLAGDKVFPKVAPAGDTLAQAVKSSRGDLSSLAKMLYYVAIQSAQKSIHIQNPYFLPDVQTRKALIDAARRGVDVKVMVPGRHIDFPLVRMASSRHYGELLLGGVKIYEYTRTMLHSKTVVVDGLFSIVGSINIDTLSMRQNAEESLTLYDRDFGARLEAVFAADMEHCSEVTYQAWNGRELHDKLADLLSWFFTPFY
jgi:cardiolipin synthase A/B